MICPTCSQPVPSYLGACLNCRPTPAQSAAAAPAQPYLAVRGIGLAAAIAVGVTAAVDLVLSFVPLISRGMAEPGLADLDVDKLNSASMLDGLAVIPGVACLLVAAVLVIIWTYRARRNIDAFPGARPTMAAGWAIAGWLVPFLAFVVPARVVANIARDSLDRARTPALVRVWWTAWLLSSVVGYRVSALIDKPPTTINDAADYQANLDFFTSEAVLEIAVAGVTVIAAAAFIRLILPIRAAQRRRLDPAEQVVLLDTGAVFPAPLGAPGLG
jgi:hypothetical protein